MLILNTTEDGKSQAELARETTIRTYTNLVAVKDDRPVRVPAQTLREARAAATKKTA